MKVIFNTLITRNYFKKQEQKPNVLAFKGFDCPEDTFELKNLYNIPCPVCSIPMIRRNQIDDFVSSTQNKTGEELISILLKYQKYFHDIESQAAEIIIQEARKNPKENIQQIVSRMASSKLADLKESQLSKLDDIRKYASNNGLSSQEQRAFNAILDEYIAKIEHGDKKINFDEMSEKISSIIKKSPSLKKRISKDIKKIPKEEEGAEQFFKKHGQKSQAEIASRLVTPAFATCEHVVPKTAGGRNNTENYLAQCEECNSKRGDKPFFDWTLANPMFQRNFKTYVDVIAQRLESGEISPKYHTYLSDITYTVKKESNGRIQVKAPVIAPLSQQEEEMSFTDYLYRFKLKLSEQQGFLESLEKETEEYKNNPQFLLVVQYNKLKDELSNIGATIRKQKSTTSQKEETKNRCYKKINELEEAKANIEGLNQGDKKYRELRATISRLESFLSQKNIPEIEQQYNNAQAELDRLEKRKSELTTRIAEIEKHITLPNSIQQKINVKKAEISKLEELYKKERGLVQKDDSDQLLAEIREQEKELGELVQQNTRINTSSSTGKEVIKYRHLLTLVDRIEVIREVYKTATKDRTQVQEDDEVFVFAKDKIQEEITDLIQNKPSVQYQINLDRIHQISENMQKLYAELEKKRKIKEEQEKLQEALKEYSTKVAALKEDLAKLEAQFIEARNLFKAANAGASIEACEERIRKREELLEDLELGKITEEDFRQAASLL